MDEFTFSHLIRNSFAEQSRFNYVSNTAAIAKMDVKNVTSLLRSRKLYFQQFYCVITASSFVCEPSKRSKQFKLSVKCTPNVTLILMMRLTSYNLMWKILFAVKLSRFRVVHGTFLSVGLICWIAFIKEIATVINFLKIFLSVKLTEKNQLNIQLLNQSFDKFIINFNDVNINFNIW